MSKLKVYQGGTNGRDTVCVAAKSWAEAHRSVSAVARNISMHYMRGYWTITRNPAQIEAAMSAPGTVFRRENDRGPYLPWTGRATMDREG